MDREISLGTLGPTGWRGVSEVLRPLALWISFCLFFLSSPYPSALIPLSYLSFPLLPSFSPSIFPCWLLNPLSYSSFLASPLHSPSSTSPVPHRYPLLFLTLHLLSASPHLFASLIPSISHSPASSPTLFFLSLKYHHFSPSNSLLFVTLSFFLSYSLVLLTPLPFSPTPEPLSYHSSSLFPCLLPLLVAFHPPSTPFSLHCTDLLCQ